jgi:hypothetical protein
MIDQFSQPDLLMARFYVVDGLSYAAAETAAGHFEGHGYRAMAICRELGFQSASAKQSMTFDDFQALVERKGLRTDNLAVAPLDHYLQHRGFDVQADPAELRMARAYLVEDKAYTESERLVGIEGKRGFAASYSVFKLGGFRGSKDRGSMNRHEFEERCKSLNISV